MGQFVMLAEEVVGGSTPTAIESLLSTLGSVVSQLINYVGSVWSLISAHPIALIGVGIGLGFTAVKFAKYILGM